MSLLMYFSVSILCLVVLLCDILEMIFQVDRLYQWKSSPGSDIQNVLKKQQQSTKGEFEERMNQVIVQMAEQVNVLQIYH